MRSNEISNVFAEVTRAAKVELSKIAEKIPHQDVSRERFENLDVARGMAIVLMFLSHTTMALNTFRTLPSYAVMPIHTITKWSSSLFILVFGITLARHYLPTCGTEKWRRSMMRLYWRAFMLLIWYKILTVVQMFQTYPRQMIIDTLLYKRFPDYVEILGFYFIILLWIPLFLPVWKKMNLPLRLAAAGGLAFAGVWLNKNFDFFGIWQLKAVLVEHKGTFCFGQFQRGALALFGMIIGAVLTGKSKHEEKKWMLAGMGILFGTICAVAFLYLTTQTYEVKHGLLPLAEVQKNILTAISKNYGKHPPARFFMTFSLAGAFFLLGISMMLGKYGLKLMRPFALIGRESFFCFNLHILIIFLIYRWAFNLRLHVTYGQTIMLFLIVFVAAAVLAPLNTKIKKSGVLWKWLLP